MKEDSDNSAQIFRTQWWWRRLRECIYEINSNRGSLTSYGRLFPFGAARNFSVERCLPYTHYGRIVDVRHREKHVCTIRQKSHDLPRCVHATAWTGGDHNSRGVAACTRLRGDTRWRQLTCQNVFNSLISSPLTRVGAYLQGSKWSRALYHQLEHKNQTNE